jgi:pyruvate dehydrogenase E2 component (dihydrolipoamide acetyltransferase)
MAEIRLPQAGMGMTDGVITIWHKTVGDPVQKGELLCEIEAAKTMVEMECPETGVITRLVAEIGETILVNDVIAEIEISDNSSAHAQALEAEPPAKTAAVTPVSPPSPAPATSAEPGVQVEARARRAAKELGVDLGAVPGSGPAGRITLEDVEAHAKRNNKAPDAIVASASRVPPSAPATAPTTVAAAGALAPPYMEVPHSTPRRTIARRLTESKQQVPHFYLTIHCEIDALLKLRRELNENAAAKVSVNDFVVRAVALALKEVPDANVSWDDTAMRRYREVDVSVAVATPRGLVTPIVRKADSKGLAEISLEIKALAKRAIEGKLKSDEYNGGNVTVSNLGMYGVEQFSAILNPPQSCIFAIGSGIEQPVVRLGQIEIATRMSVTLSVDHRAVDGALGAQLLAAFKRLIENPVALHG